MQVIWGLLILGILQFIIKCNGAFFYDPRNLKKLEQSHIVKGSLHQSSGEKTNSDINSPLEILEEPQITESTSFSSEKNKDTLNAQFNEVQSTVLKPSDMPHMESKYANEQNSENYEKINPSPGNSSHTDLTQNAYFVLKSNNTPQNRMPRFIPEEIYFSSPQGERFPRQYGVGDGGNNGGFFGGPGGMMPTFMGGINAMLPFGVPPAAYIPAPGGGIIPAIPPSTFIPPPPMPFPGAWGAFGFAGHGLGFPPIPYAPTFFGGPTLG